MFPGVWLNSFGLVLRSLTLYPHFGHDVTACSLFDNHLYPQWLHWTGNPRVFLAPMNYGM